MSNRFVLHFNKITQCVVRCILGNYNRFWLVLKVNWTVADKFENARMKKARKNANFSFKVDKCLIVVYDRLLGYFGSVNLACVFVSDSVNFAKSSFSKWVKKLEVVENILW